MDLADPWTGGAPPSRSLSRTLWLVVATWVLIVTMVAGPSVAHAQQELADSARMLPVDGRVVRSFEAPKNAWSAGHRGVDLAAPAGSEIRAAAAGTISWVGTIDGITSVTVSHADGLRTTYLPLEARVAQGDQVGAGQLIGLLRAGHGDPDSLHWGLLRDKDYLDPMDWLTGSGAGRVSLLPHGTRVKRALPEGWSGLLDAAMAILSPSGTAVMPAQGPLTSPFGTRTNPVLGSTEVHDGLDIGAACGSPVRAAWSGTVRFAGVVSGFGNRVEIDHGAQPRASAATSYNHMSDAGIGLVRVGDRVQAGQVIGLVGTTGLSTGCHLHFSTYRDGRAVDPMPFL